MGKRAYKKKSDARKRPRSHTRLFPLVLGFFFLSGITGLIYEILWTRMIVSIIGSAPFAVSIVLSVFMGGLGLGSYLASKRIDEVREPGRLLEIYGLLELVVGVYGLFLPIALRVFRPLYTVIYNGVFHHFMLYNLLTFAGCAAILLLPATCMGATLPVLSRFYIRRIGQVGSHLGQLYGINTIGAAVGSLLCGFWIIGWWGVWVALGIAVVFNVLIGIICITLGGSNRHAKPAPAAEADRHVDITYDPSGFGHIALAVFAVSGFCAMAYEVIWTRLLELIAGPTTFSFTLVVTIFILGLALGSMLFGRLADRFGRAELLLVGTQALAALSVLAVSQILGNSQFLFAKLIYEFQDRFTTLMLMKSAVIFSLMFLPTFLLGATFPLVGKIYTRSTAAVGRSIGFAYAVNTAGAVLGSFCAGFVIIPVLGKEHGIRMLVILQLLTAFGAGLYIAVKNMVSRRVLVPAALALILGMAGIARYPHWDRLMLAVGKYQRTVTFDIGSLGWFDSLFNWSDHYQSGEIDELMYFGDGIGGFTTVVKTAGLLGVDEYSLFNSGKAEASSAGFDMFTQTMLAHFPMIFHPRPRSVMVLGLASGITAGEVLHYPVERLDVVDINEQVVEASGFFAPWNNNVLDDPRTELIIQDARAHIQMTDRMYDVIISEPSNPWMAGLASLFTREFFEAFDRHLNDGGVFCQWMHSYQIDWENFSLIGRTFLSQFPNSVLVTFNPDRPWPDYLLIGMKGDRTLDPITARTNFPYAGKSTNMVFRNPDVLFSLILAENLDELFGDGPLNTDSMPLLEFNAPKQAYSNDPAIPENIMARRKLTRQTLDIRRQYLSDVDYQLDLLEMLYGFDVPRGDFVTLEKATPGQRDRYRRIVFDYCARNVLTDFSFIPDDEIREEAIEHHIAAMYEAVERSLSPHFIYTHLGNLAGQRGDDDAAYACYEQAIQSEPEYDLPYYDIGLIEESRGNTAEAARYYRMALARNPRNAYAHNNLAIILAGQNNLQEAVRHYREALAVDPTLSITHLNLGHALRSLGQTEEGDRHIRQGQLLQQQGN